VEDRAKEKNCGREKKLCDLSYEMWVSLSYVCECGEKLGKRMKCLRDREMLKSSMGLMIWVVFEEHLGLGIGRRIGQF
jgi:hypothetical protein